MEATGEGFVKQVMIEATIFRADGTVEELGVIADSDWEDDSEEKKLAEERILKANGNLRS